MKMGKQTGQTESKEESGDDQVPVFNKRLYVARGTVVVTSAARRIMERNRKALGPGRLPVRLSRSELHIMRSVVDGLKLIHKGHAHVKEVLSHVVTLEKYSTHQYVEKQEHENQLSCYFILSGSVLVTYALQTETETRSVHQPHIIYNHGCGEYFGLVSHEGLADDLSSPANVCTKEPTELLRVDRQAFHRLMDQHNESLGEKKRKFLSDPRCVLANMPSHALERILPHVTKMDVWANRTVITQGQPCESVYFVVSGRCEMTRSVHVPEVGHKLTLSVDSREPFSFFAEECLVDLSPSQFTVSTCTPTTFFCLHRTSLEVVVKDHLYNILAENMHQFPSDEELRDIGYTTSVWNQFKRAQVKRYLTEVGAEHHMVPRLGGLIRKKTPSKEVLHKERLLNFSFNNSRRTTTQTSPATSSYRPASSRPTARRRQLRPQTAIGLSTSIKRAAETGRRSPAIAARPSTVSGTRVVRTVTTATSTITSGSRSRLQDLSMDRLSNLLDRSECRRNTQRSESSETSEEEGEQGLQDDASIHPSDGGMPSWSHSPTSVNGQEDLPDDGSNGQGRMHGFMTTSVLATMASEDIVRKAKALADRSTSVKDSRNDGSGQTDEWSTVLHEEHTIARESVYANKYRVAILKHRMALLRSKRPGHSAVAVATSNLPPPPPPSPPPPQPTPSSLSSDRVSLLHHDEDGSHGGNGYHMANVSGDDSGASSGGHREDNNTEENKSTSQKYAYEDGLLKMIDDVLTLDIDKTTAPRTGASTTKAGDEDCITINSDEIDPRVLPSPRINNDITLPTPSSEKTARPSQLLDTSICGKELCDSKIRNVEEHELESVENSDDADQAFDNSTRLPCSTKEDELSEEGMLVSTEHGEGRGGRLSESLGKSSRKCWCSTRRELSASLGESRVRSHRPSRKRRGRSLQKNRL